MARCKFCHNFSGDSNLQLQHKIRSLYQSADNGCTTCQIARRAIQDLVQVQPSLESNYIIWVSSLGARTDMAQPETSTQWGLYLRVQENNEHFDISFYTLAGMTFL